MTRIPIVALVLTILSASCGGATSASNCTEYAAQLNQMIREGASGEELSVFIEDTSEHAARLIQKNPDGAQPCVDSILEATFSAAFEDIDAFLDQ